MKYICICGFVILCCEKSINFMVFLDDADDPIPTTSLTSQGKLRNLWDNVTVCPWKKENSSKIQLKLKVSNIWSGQEFAF